MNVQVISINPWEGFDMTPIKTNIYRLIAISLVAQCCSNEAFLQEHIDHPDPNLSAHVIYGQDGRADLYEVQSPQIKQLAQSTVALIKTTQLSTNGEWTLIKGTSYGNSQQLCSSERFREQSASAFCSGSLVSPDTIITAGHCITNQSDCVSTQMVFGYALQQQGVLPQQIPSSEVYRCREIIKQVLENNGADYAIIKLDRPVVGHEPLNYRLSGEPQIGDQLVVIGHPSGLPTKITTGGQVRSIASPSFFTANVDTYGGNSGSAVFNAQTGLIEGILVRGEVDFTYSNGCYVSKVCQDQSCRGEDITRISVVRPHLPASETQVPTPTLPTPPGSTSGTPILKTETFQSQLIVKIPDNKQTGSQSTLLVNTLPKNRQILVTLNIQHTYIGDLIVKIQSPSGKTILLHNRSDGSKDNIQKTYNLTQELSGENQSGQYKLNLQDLAAVDIGQLNSWTIQFKKIE